MLPGATVLYFLEVFFCLHPVHATVSRSGFLAGLVSTSHQDKDGIKLREALEIDAKFLGFKEANAQMRLRLPRGFFNCSDKKPGDIPLRTKSNTKMVNVIFISSIQPFT
jgi:hypothetical protein